MADQAAGSNIEATIRVDITTEQQTYIISVCRAWQSALNTQYSLRNAFEEIDRVYMREKDWTDEQIKAKLANRIGDPTKFQNIIVPIVMPQVNSATTYLTQVFLTGYPLFPVIADPDNEDAALQLETIIQENATTANWPRELMMFFRDGLKYNLHAVECEWQQRTNWTIENDVVKKNSASPKKVIWQGNVLKRMDLYNTFWDPRVHPAEVHMHGEFIGYTELYSRVRFKTFTNSLYNIAAKKDVIAAINSAPVQGALGASVTAPYGYYLPIINPWPFYNRSAPQDWINWAQNIPGVKNGVDYKNAYSVTKVYARIIPSDFGLNVPEKNTPQVWKFIIVNGQVVLSAERLTNVHNYLPIFFGQPLEDGLDYQTKSFAQNVSDMQAVASAMYNGYIASKRRLIGDRVLYDPSRIKKADINSINPEAKIPVLPAAYGKPLNEAVYAFPFKDDQVESLIQGTAAVTGMANLINGQNPAQQGQFVKGNKTRREYEDVMGHGNGQNMMIAISIEGQVFTPIKEVIKLNILQFQTPDKVYNKGKGQTIDVNPVDLRKSEVHFKVADGLIPADKLSGDDVLQVAMQQIGTSPQIAQDYNVGDVFSYFMKTQGFDLTPFQKSQEQKLYEQQLAAWQNAAAQAAKSGVDFSAPQPQPSPELKQEMQQKQSGKAEASITSSALESTQG